VQRVLGHAVHGVRGAEFESARQPARVWAYFFYLPAICLYIVLLLTGNNAAVTGLRLPSTRVNQASCCSHVTRLPHPVLSTCRPASCDL